MTRAIAPAVDVEAMFDRMMHLSKAMTVNEAHEVVRQEIFALHDARAVDTKAARRLAGWAEDAYERVCRTVLSRSR